MLTIHIAEQETPPHAATTTESPDALAACLAQYGVSPRLIQSALATLRQVKTLVLYRPSEAAAWEIADAPRPPELPVEGVG
jgi:hypothetical protein